MKKILRILLIAVIAVVLIGTFVMLWKKSQPEQIIYEILTVDRGNIEVTSVATGKLSPRDEVLIKPQISGIISELRKEAGEYVKQGEIIAMVKVIPEMTQLNSAESRVRIAEINLKQVESENRRQREIFGKGVISQQEMEESDALYRKSLEELSNSQSNLEIVRDGISRKSAQSSNTQIRSTIDGMVLDVPIKIGNSVIMSNTFNDGTTIASVANMNDMIFIGDIDETEVGRIKEGMPMLLSVGALQGVSFDAVLEYISPKGVEKNGAMLFEIKAAATIPDEVTVRAGYSANAQVTLSRADSVLVIPESTLVFENDSTFVSILTSNGTADQEFKKVAVEIGLSNGVMVEIKSGLELGESVKGNQVVKK